MARCRSKRLKDLLRYAKILERKRLFREAYWDKNRCELIAQQDYPLHNISKGEVLFIKNRYVNPSLNKP
jgi:hypothetical protein